MKVYLVTSGAFDSFHVEFVFLDRAKAEATAALLGSCDADVEEFTVEDEVPRRVTLLFLRDDGHIASWTDWADNSHPECQVHQDFRYLAPSYSTLVRGWAIEGTNHDLVRQTFAQLQSAQGPTAKNASACDLEASQGTQAP